MTDVLKDFKLGAEVVPPKKTVSRSGAKKLIKETEDAVFEDFSDWQLIKGTLKRIYKRHSTSWWQLIALAELGIIVWLIWRELS
jgi:hypothetical protein